MGFLQLKMRLEAAFNKDPFELFMLGEPQRVVRSLRSEAIGSVVVGFVCASVVAAAVLWQWRTRSEGREDEPYAYFEIKAIGPDGRAVAGAMVQAAGKQLGVTDSFGEWRRFMHARLGSTVAVYLSKKTEQTTLGAVKSIVVPTSAPNGGDLELKGNVQLLPVVGSGSLQTLVPVVAHGSNKIVTTPAPVAPVAAAASLSATPSPAVSTASPTADFTAFSLKIWGHTSPGLQAVAHALEGRARALGLVVAADAAWQIQLTELNTHDAKGRLLKVDAYHRGSKNQGGAPSPTLLYSFLHNYSETPLQTARELLWLTSLHVAKTYRVEKGVEHWTVMPPSAQLWSLSAGRRVYSQKGEVFRIEGEGKDRGEVYLSATAAAPCGSGGEQPCTVQSGGIDREPPLPGWQRLQLKVFGTIDPDTHIYVSGYLAQARSPKIYEYWGAPMGAGMVTVVRADHVLYRGRLVESGGGIPSLSLPSASLSRR